MQPETFAMYEKYLQAKRWFDAACDDRNATLAELESWRRVARRRYRVGTTYVLCFCFFVAGLCIGMIHP